MNTHGFSYPPPLSFVKKTRLSKKIMDCGWEHSLVEGHMLGRFDPQQCQGKLIY